MSKCPDEVCIRNPFGHNSKMVKTLHDIVVKTSRWRPRCQNIPFGQNIYRGGKKQQGALAPPKSALEAEPTHFSSQVVYIIILYITTLMCVSCTPCCLLACINIHMIIHPHFSSQIALEAISENRNLKFPWGQSFW